MTLSAGCPKGLTAGVDIGSVATKCVLVQGQKIIGKALSRTGADIERVAEEVFEQALCDAKKNIADITSIVSTGYGRRIFKKAGRVITEISAAGYGGYVLSGRMPCLILDVGGQDTKIIDVNARGEVIDFLMNDKCAAGTGRFLEMMAGVLGTELEDFSDLAMDSANPVSINSTCSVFAESEVVSLLAGAARKEDVAAGLFRAIALRISAMLGQFGRDRDILFCGGGAKSGALKFNLEDITGSRFLVIDEPQFAVAFGAAILEEGRLL